MQYSTAIDSTLTIGKINAIIDEANNRTALKTGEYIYNQRKPEQ
jgi:hypothetical protein